MSCTNKIAESDVHSSASARQPDVFGRTSGGTVLGVPSHELQIGEEHRTKEHLSLWIGLDDIEKYFNRSIRCFFLFVKCVLTGLAVNSLFAVVLTALRIHYLRQKSVPDLSVWYWMSVSLQTPELKHWIYVFSPLSTCIVLCIPLLYNWKLQRMKEAEDSNSPWFDYSFFKHRNVTLGIPNGKMGLPTSTPLDIIDQHKKRMQHLLYPHTLQIQEVDTSVTAVAAPETFPLAYTTIASPSNTSICRGDVLPSIRPPAPCHSSNNVASSTPWINAFHDTRDDHSSAPPTVQSTHPEGNRGITRVMCACVLFDEHDRVRTLYMIKPLLSYVFSLVMGAGFLVAQVFINIHVLQNAVSMSELMLTFLLSIVSMVMYTLWTRIALWLTSHMEHHDTSNGHYQSYFLKIFVYRLGSTLVLFFLSRMFVQTNTSASSFCPYTSLTQQYISELLSQIVLAITKTAVLHMYRLVAVRLFRKREQSDLEWVPAFVLEEEIINVLHLLFLYLYGLHVFPLLSACCLLTIVMLSAITRYRLFKVCKPVDRGLKKSFRTLLLTANTLNALVAFWFGFMSILLGYSQDTSLDCSVV